PSPPVPPMDDWVLDQQPERVVDDGAGSGRFLAELLRRDPSITAVAVDLDPMATLMTRATVAALGGTGVQVKQADYTRFRLPAITGRTAFVGNPPYVRHHQPTAQTQPWAQTAAPTPGHKVSGLPGIHTDSLLANALSR